jgi:hypothetical protein
VGCYGGEAMGLYPLPVLDEHLFVGGHPIDAGTLAASQKCQGGPQTRGDSVDLSKRRHNKSLTP